jgi:plasmid stabilization system protein ParE
MKIVFLVSARRDLLWFRQYYGQIFPEGEKRAAEQFKASIATLKRHPQIGHEIKGLTIREFTLPRTPFSFIYRIQHDRIEVLRLWDNRSGRAIKDA